MRFIADKVLGAVRRFAALRGAQLAEVALAFVVNGTLAAGFLLAAKVVRAVATVMARA